MIHRQKSHTIDIDGGSVTVTREGETDTIEVSNIDNLSIVEDYTLIDRIDLIVQSFFALCLAVLLGSFTLLLFVGVDLGTPHKVIRSLLKRNFLLTSFLFGGGMISPTILFLVYYKYVRSRLVSTFSPSESVIEFTAGDEEYKLMGIDQQKAHDLTVKVQEFNDS